MTRDNLIKFLTEQYEPNEELVWQTISYEDVENALAEQLPQLTPGYWVGFVEKQDYYGNLATSFSEDTFSEFYDFVVVPEEDN